MQNRLLGEQVNIRASLAKVLDHAPRYPRGHGEVSCVRRRCEHGAPLSGEWVLAARPRCKELCRPEVREPETQATTPGEQLR